MTKLSQLKDGQPFTFADCPGVEYIARGNTWYGTREGYDGGPWHRDGDAEVVLVEPFDPPDEVIERFCGAWSVSAKNVKVLLHPDANVPAWFLEDTRRHVIRYWTGIKGLLEEYELKMPNDESLPYWRAAVEFFGNVVAASDRKKVEA